MAPFPTRKHSIKATVSSPTATRSEIEVDPIDLFGDVAEPGPGILLSGLGQSWESGRVVKMALRENHIKNHIFFNDKGFHNHLAHHLLAAYSLGAGPKLLKAIYDLDSLVMKPMLPFQPVEITEANWREFLGDERYYPNYLAFFHRLIATPPHHHSPYAGCASSVVPVLERFLLDGESQMLVRAVSGAIHSLIHIGHGVEFGVDALVAEGLAQCCIHSAQLASLFPPLWPALSPPPSSHPLRSALSHLHLAPPEHPPISTLSTGSFARTALSLPRTKGRVPRTGSSAFTIVHRMLNDPELAPGNGVRMEDNPKLGAVVDRWGEKLRTWCAEWEIGESGEEDEEERVGEKERWEECVEKCEELIWLATVIYASSSRPGYVDVKLDFFLMHGLTSVLFLPSLLEVVSPHLRPALLHSHFRVLVSYWVSRGRPNLFIEETLMAASAFPGPPEGTGKDNRNAVDRALGEEKRGNENSGEEVNPWCALIASAADHSDDHVPKVIRTLAFAASIFGRSPPGFYKSSLPGTQIMDGSIFVRAAGLTLQSMGWAHEGSPAAEDWDRSVLGFDEAWERITRLPGFGEKGKGKEEDGVEAGFVQGLERGQLEKREGWRFEEGHRERGEDEVREREEQEEREAEEEEEDRAMLSP